MNSDLCVPGNCHDKGCTATLSPIVLSSIWFSLSKDVTQNLCQKPLIDTLMQEEGGRRLKYILALNQEKTPEVGSSVSQGGWGL